MSSLKNFAADVKDTYKRDPTRFKTTLTVFVLVIVVVIAFAVTRPKKPSLVKSPFGFRSTPYPMAEPSPLVAGVMAGTEVSREATATPSSFARLSLAPGTPLRHI